MWIKRPEDELQSLKRRKGKGSRLRAAIFLVVVIFAALLLFRPHAAEEGHLFWSDPQEMAAASGPALFVSILAGVSFYFFPFQRKQIVVCDRCGKSEYKGPDSKCSCGGNLENIETMQWVDNG